MKAKFEVTITGKWLENSTPATPAMAERRLRRAAKDGFDFLAAVAVKRAPPDGAPPGFVPQRVLEGRDAYITEMESRVGLLRGRIAELEAAIDKLADKGGGSYINVADYKSLIEVRNKSLHK